MVVHARYPIGEPRVQREAIAARSAGYDVDVLCLRSPGEAPQETVDGIRVRRLPIRHARGAGLGRILVEYLAFALLATLCLVLDILRQRRPAIVQVHAPPDFLAFAGLIPKLAGSRLILDIHDLSPHMYAARFGGRSAVVVNRALTLVERAACAIAGDVITVHEPYRRELAGHGVPDDRITVVMNAVDEKLIERITSGGGPPAGAPFTVAYHGTLNHWYGVDLLLDALATGVPEAHAIILGEGDALGALRERAAQDGLDGRVEFSGRYLPIEEALAKVAQTSCGVIPNRPSTLNRFALSSKLFEYVELSIPVVVARLETLGEHFCDDDVTFFEPGDADSLADAIRWVAANPAAARSKAARARETARRYSWMENRVRYLQLLTRG